MWRAASVLLSQSIRKQQPVQFLQPRLHACFGTAADTRKGPGLLWGTLRLALVAGGVVAVGSTVIPTEQLTLAYLIPLRLARDVQTAAAIMLDYKFHLKPELEGEDRERVLHECHVRGADRLLQLCFKNGGVYTKLGQHLGQLDHMLPEEYVLTMRNHLLDSCPVSPFSEVKRIVTADLGRPPEQLFRRFDPNPIASASLAQVHVAEDFEGNKLAVKVQHAGLRESSAADIVTVQLLVQLAKFVFPDFDYQWLVEEVKHNLPLELDFRHEASNANRCRQNLTGPKSRLGHKVHIPHIYEDKTSARVLTMEFINGASATDLPALRNMGISPSRVSRIISEAFNEMIFIHGDVHADPHAANLLVRKQHGRTQLVLLDHGLYRRLDDKFRLEYASLWRSLVYADVAGIESSSKAMGAGDMVPLFAGMLTQRPWEAVTSTKDVNRLHVPSTRENRDMVQMYAARYARQIASMLTRMPRELLLLLKTNDCLRAVDSCLGQPVNNILVTARECTRALAEQQLAEARTPWAQFTTRTRVTWQVFRIEVQLAALRVMTTWSWLKLQLGMIGRRPEEQPMVMVT